MVGRRGLALITMLIAILALLGAPEVEARMHRHRRAASRPRRCHSDKQCHGGTCNDAGQCCRADEITCGTSCCNKLLADACCNGQCVDFARNDNNCGGCGIVCTGGKSCQDGVCTCLADEVDCGNKCANLFVDDDNCGACGHMCDADLKCFLGECGCKDIYQTLCDGQCVDLHTSRDDCGWCGNVCLAGGDCVDGECLLPCGPCEERVNNVCVPKDGETDCNGVCVHTQTDPHNCGGCGAGCPSGITCTNGTCDFCGVGYTTCHPPDPNRVVGCCRQDIAPVCCESSMGGGCCTTDTTCCDGYCCPAGTQCCVNSRHTYPCIPAGQPCLG